MKFIFASTQKNNTVAITACSKLMHKIKTMSIVLARLKGSWKQLSRDPHKKEKRKENAETDATESYTACLVDMSRTCQD